ncbi:MAG TPA: DUF4199 domain-containing protein [Flavobacteriales bacterium]|nr:DUF4199 domain-containing protein [Flavobacteriales bacterium]
MVFAALTALVVIAFRLVLFYSGNSPEGAEFLIVHFLAVITAVFITDQKLLRTNKDVTFPELMREGFKSAAVYAILVSIFIWVFYTWVDMHYFEQRVNAMVHQGVLAGKKEQDIRPNIMRFFTPFNYTTITFFTLLITGALNALVIAAIHHKVLRRFAR